jgi:LysR family positive regulator for ilvC
MDIEHIKLFIDLTHTLHFGKTSQRGFVTPATLTRIIQRMESQVGKPLFYRDNRSVTLTKAGELFKSYCKDHIQRWDELHETIGHSTGRVSGLVRIYCSVTASHSVLSTILAPIKDQYPEIIISLETGPSELTFQKIRQDETDIGITSFSDHRPSGIITTPISEIELVLIVPKGKTVPDITSQSLPFIYPQSRILKAHINAWFKLKKWIPKHYPSAASFDGILTLVGLGYGASIVPKMVVDTSPLRNQLDYLAITPPIKKLQMGMCCKKKNILSPCVSAIMTTSAPL